MPDIFVAVLVAAAVIGISLVMILIANSKNYNEGKV